MTQARAQTCSTQSGDMQQNQQNQQEILLITTAAWLVNILALTTVNKSWFHYHCHPKHFLRWISVGMNFNGF